MSEHALILHQFEASPFCDKIRRLLAYKQLPHRVVDYPMSAGARVKKLNPRGKLPALEHAGRLVTDSTDIAHYLDEQFPAFPVIPVDPRDRALVHVLEDWADESLYFYEMTLRFVRSTAAPRNVDKLMKHDTGLRGWIVRRLVRSRVGIPMIASLQGVGRKPTDLLLADCRRHVMAVAGLLGDRDWLVGDTLSLADLAVHSMLACFEDAPEAAAILHSTPGVTAWMERVRGVTGGI